MRILLGVTGSIAAYKSCFLLRRLQDHNHQVKVVTTKGAENFVTPLTFETLAKGEYYSGDLWIPEGKKEALWTLHVDLAKWAECLLIAPCTAHTIAKLAHGYCDDLLTAVALSYDGPKYLAPAMEEQMYFAPATQRNLALLKQWGWMEIEPEDGPLASGLSGYGRMAEPETILQAISYKPLQGKKVLITLGPTYEPIDPVRFIGNHSTGKMGAAIAQVALQYGAEVTIIAGPVSIPLPKAHQLIQITTAQELFETIMPIASQYDYIWMVAAVADYTPVEVKSEKIKKEENPNLTLSLKPNPDILANLTQQKRPGQKIIGFALESDYDLEKAKQKLKRKNCDLLVLNSLLLKGSGFGTDTNHVFAIMPDGTIHEFPMAPKRIIAKQLWDLVLSLPNEV